MNLNQRTLAALLFLALPVLPQTDSQWILEQSIYRLDSEYIFITATALKGWSGSPHCGLMKKRSNPQIRRSLNAT